MKLKGVIVDADFCIKVGASSKYRYLEKLLGILSEKTYIHRTVYDEIQYPLSAKEQIDTLIYRGIVRIIDESILDQDERILYRWTCSELAKVMANPRRPRKNLGEICSIAMAKTKSIQYFATDEKDLQPIIDKLLNTGINDIECIRIEDVVKLIRNGVIEGFTRKEARSAVEAGR